MLPLILQLSTLKYRKAEKLPIEVGRVPLSGLPNKTSLVNPLQFAKEERNLNSGVEDSPVKLFKARLRRRRFLKLPRVVGIGPDKEFELISAMLSLEALEKDAGSGPLSRFLVT